MRKLVKYILLILTAMLLGIIIYNYSFIKYVYNLLAYNCEDVRDDFNGMKREDYFSVSRWMDGFDLYVNMKYKKSFHELTDIDVAIAFSEIMTVCLSEVDSKYNIIFGIQDAAKNHESNILYNAQSVLKDGGLIKTYKKIAGKWHE